MTEQDELSETIDVLLNDYYSIKCADAIHACAEAFRTTQANGRNLSRIIDMAKDRLPLAPVGESTDVAVIRGSL